MKLSLEKDELEALLEMKDYRAFIRTWIELKSKRRKFGYSDIARIGGLSARSFPRDIAAGSKRISLTSLPKIVRGLGLNRELADYFRTLVELEHEDCRVKNFDTASVANERNKLRERLLSRAGLSILKSDDAFQVSSIPEVYASLGDSAKGAKLKEIKTRCGLPSHEIEAALVQMVKMGIVEKKKDVYLALRTHLSFEGLKESDVFKKHFIRGCERSAAMAAATLNSEEKLFFSSAFSVNRHELPRLKEELRSVLLKYVDTSERTSGDKVINLVTSLF